MIGSYYETGVGSYYETSGQLGAVGPGIDLSHYGAPYQGMLGLGGCVGCAGLGWVPGAGQSPADDPRIVKQFAKVRQTFRVRGIAGKTAETATAILNAASAAFPGHRVRKASGDGYGAGWGPGGRVGVDIIIAAPTRLGELKMKGRSLQTRNVISRVNPGAALQDARTGVDASQLQETPGVAPAFPGTPADFDAPAPVSEPSEGSFLTRRVGGLPVWAVGGLGVAALVGIGFAVTRKKPVAKNRRRRRR
jgi:hypothetical protein